MDEDAFLAKGVHLLVLPGEAGIAVVEAEAFGDGVLEILEARSIVVRVERSAAQGNEADNQATRAVCLWRMRSGSLPRVVRLGDGGRYGTNSVKQTGIEPAE